MEPPLARLGEKAGPRHPDWEAGFTRRPLPGGFRSQRLRAAASPGVGGGGLLGAGASATPAHGPSGEWGAPPGVKQQTWTRPLTGSKPAQDSSLDTPLCPCGGDLTPRPPPAPPARGATKAGRTAHAVSFPLRKPSICSICSSFISVSPRSLVLIQGPQEPPIWGAMKKETSFSPNSPAGVQQRVRTARLWAAQCHSLAVRP